jgi:dTDP-4-dehydrorhamnose reductase
VGTILNEIAKNNNFLTYGTYYSNFVPNCTKLDVSKIEDVEKIVSQINPDFIINLASQNNVDFLESNSDLAMIVNCDGASNVAQIAHETKIKLLHVSTDSVFDGIKGNYSENDQPNPINVYAKSKYEGEQSVIKNCKNSIVARTNFYGINPFEKYFLNWILIQLKNNVPMVGFTDVIFSPLSVKNLSQIFIELMEIKFTGIIHLSSTYSISKYDFISKIITSLNLPQTLVKPGEISSLNFKAQRPKNTSLSNKLASTVLKTKIVEFDDWLEKNKSNIMKCIHH